MGVWPQKKRRRDPQMTKPSPYK